MPSVAFSCRSQTHIPFRDAKLPLDIYERPPMLKVFTDFNARSRDDFCWNLKYDNVDLEKKIDDLKLNAGDKVQLFQDENDFEVTAVLDYRYVDILNRKAWVAIPDWSTLVRKPA
jgi:hypothetical protein